VNNVISAAVTLTLFASLLCFVMCDMPVSHVMCEQLHAIASAALHWQ
jgi:hypothetical protein